MQVHMHCPLLQYCLTNAVMPILIKLCPTVTGTCVISLIIVTKQTKVSTTTIADGTRVYTYRVYNY